MDPRVGHALDELNDSMTAVNDLEGALMAARRRRKSTVAEQQLKMAVVEKNLSSSVRSAVPFFHRQAMVGVLPVKTRTTDIAAFSA